MNRFTYRLKKSSFFRFFVLLVLLSFTVFGFRLILGFLSKKPTITDISPKLLKLGDTVVITGKDFGKVDESRGLRLNDSFLSSTSCLTWTDNRISFKVPKNFKTSLISVSVANVCSEKKVLSFSDEIPKLLEKRVLLSLPEIHSLSKDTASVGECITIYGKNFGTSRQDSQVIFTEMSEDLINENISEIDGVNCNEAEQDFVSWSDSEIRIHIPDGARSSNMLVQTSAGLSNFVPFRVSTQVGEKKLSNKRSFLLSLSASVQDIEVKSKQNTLFLLLAQPVESYMQKNIHLYSTSVEPFARNFQNSTIYRFENLNENTTISVMEQIALETYDVDVIVKPRNISAKINLKPDMQKYSSSEMSTPSDNEEIRALAKKICKGSTNPYNNAKSIFDYLVKNIKPVSRTVNDTPDVVACLKNKSADDYELSLAFCTLMRAVSVPCIQVSGIIIDQAQKAHLHWWNEFYIDGLAWVPLDIALARKSFTDGDANTSKYFATLDGLHIAFSRGNQVQTQMLSESMIVNKNKSYVSRQIWEESVGLLAYNSLWTIPKMISIR